MNAPRTMKLKYVAAAQVEKLRNAYHKEIERRKDAERKVRELRAAAGLVLGAGDAARVQVALRALKEVMAEGKGGPR